MVSLDTTTGLEDFTVLLSVSKTNRRKMDCKYTHKHISVFESVLHTTGIYDIMG